MVGIEVAGLGREGSAETRLVSRHRLLSACFLFFGREGGCLGLAGSLVPFSRAHRREVGANSRELGANRREQQLLRSYGPPANG